MTFFGTARAAFYGNLLTIAMTFLKGLKFEGMVTNIFSKGFVIGGAVRAGSDSSFWAAAP